MSALLDVDGLTKSFGGLRVVEDVTFALAAGGRLALIGPNGAGKTTVFNLLSGVYDPDVGKVSLAGRDITNVVSRKRIGLGMARSFQNIRLMPHMSVVDNVMLGQQARAAGLGALLTPLSPLWRSRWRAEAETRLADFGLAAYRTSMIADLPYGVRKKIEIIRALIAAPKVLLLDEPAAGLNPRETAELKDFLLSVAESGIALLVIEHDMSLVRGLCPDCFVLNFGRRIYQGSTAAVHEDQAVLEAYLGPRDAAVADGARQKALPHVA
jgi:branched-chain amino acid transport system ATP-binding protein